MFEIVIRTTKRGQLEDILMVLPPGLNPQINRIAGDVKMIEHHPIRSDLASPIQGQIIELMNDGRSHRMCDIMHQMPGTPKQSVGSAIYSLVRKRIVRKRGYGKYGLVNGGHHVDA